MHARRPRASRGTKTIAWTTALIAGLAIACSTVLNIDDDPQPVVPGAEGGVDGAPDSNSNPDAEGDPDVGELLPGTDGAADDGAPIISTGDGGFDAAVPPGCPGIASCERVVFVSSIALLARQVTFTAANQICTTLAKAGGVLPRILGRSFVAWISDGAGNDPKNNPLFPKGTGNYIRPDGTIIATSFTDLTDGNLALSIFHDEKGVGAPAGSHVWTGTAASGAFQAPNCLGWTKGMDADTGRIGVVGAKSANWSSFANDSCGQMRRLYCFEK